MLDHDIDFLLLSTILIDISYFNLLPFMFLLLLPFECEISRCSNSFYATANVDVARSFFFASTPCTELMLSLAAASQTSLSIIGALVVLIATNIWTVIIGQYILFMIDLGRFCFPPCVNNIWSGRSNSYHVPFISAC